MAEIQASFIPKKDIKKRKQRGGGFSVNIFLLIAVVVFLTAIFAALGEFLLEKKTQSDIDTVSATLEREKDNFGLSAIREFVLASNRLEAADEIINNHINVSEVFRLLESDTLTEVVISNFSFTSEQDKVVITGRGTAPTFEHVAAQSQKYGENNRIGDLILSDVDQDREGGVVFNISFSVDKTYLLAN